MAFMPPEHAVEVRSALAEIVAEHGPAALSRPSAMASLLADLLPEAPGLARLMVAAAQDRIADELAGHVAQGMDAATAARIVTSSFATATLYPPEVCAWVVGEFAVALGLRPDSAQISPEPAASPDNPEPEGAHEAVPAETSATAEVVPAQPLSHGSSHQAGSPASDGPAPLPDPALTATASPPTAGTMESAATARPSPASPAQVAGQPDTPRHVPDFSDWHPEISKRYRYWLLMAYIVPIAGFGAFGIPVLLLLMIRRDRLFRMNALQSLELILFAAPTIAFSVTANLARTVTPKVLFAIAAGICGLIVIYLCIFCIAKVARRRQPRIILLSKMAYRLAYGRSS